MIASFYAGILAILYMGLTYFVIHGRWKYKIGLGDGGNQMMLQRIRIHGNFMEFVPFALLLLFMLDYARFSSILIHILGVALVIGRVAHAQGLYISAYTSFGRAFGTFLTHLVIIVSAALLIWKFLVIQTTSF